MKKVIKKYADWSKLPWGEIQTHTFNLQSKIYKYAKRNDRVNVLRFQKKLVNSKYAKLLAVRMITQDNRGKENCRGRWSFGIES
jgi:RNA-directed DNA polymerase